MAVWAYLGQPRFVNIQGGSLKDLCRLSQSILGSGASVHVKDSLRSCTSICARTTMTTASTVRLEIKSGKLSSSLKGGQEQTCRERLRGLAKAA
jgi:hypothetical protein